MSLSSSSPPPPPGGMGCPLNADDQFGPRVDLACRPFDFTLLFEDAFFAALPAALFLLLLPLRLRSLYNTPVKVISYQLASWKLALIALVFVFHLLFLIFRLGTSSLHTKLSISSGVLTAAATLAAAIQSFLEDQRSLMPSDMLVVYFSASSLLYVPRLRTLWLISSGALPQIMWSVTFAGTVLLVFFESAKKTKLLRPPYQGIATAEQATGFWSRGFFFWVLPFFQTGYATVMQLQDIPKVDTHLEEESAVTKLQTLWNRSRRGHHRLLRATFRAYYQTFFNAIPPRIALTAFTFCQPFLIEASVKYMNSERKDEEEQANYGQALVGAFVLAYLGIAVSRAIYSRQTNRMLAQIRSGLIGSIYRHTTTLQASALKDSAAITLMGTDVERIIQSLGHVHELWASIPEVALGIWLLARQVGVASVMPMVICVVSLVGASAVARHFGPAQRSWVERVEKRIAVTASMLGDMKAVKMLALSRVLEPVISRLRVAELKTSEKFRSLLIWQIMVSNMPETLAPFMTFTVYAIIAVSKKDQGLLSAQAFASLSLVNLVTFPLLIFCQALPSITQAAACFQRIEEYLLKTSASPEMPYHSSPSLLEAAEAESMVPLRQLPTTLAAATAGGSALITFEGADIAWSRSSEAIILRDVNLAIQPGLTAIIGQVGSGKSTLLASIIGENALLRGSVTPSSLSGVAFCSQTPWMMNDTIRYNIVGGMEFDQKWYNFSVSVSGLEADLDVMSAGDQTRAGTNGASLSGGQRQRVALTRAIYSRLPMVILDDVMSGLDARTANLVTGSLFGPEGHFRKAGISVVLATHSRRILPHMDTIVVLDDGKIADTGSYHEVLVQSADLVQQAEATLEIGSETVKESTRVQSEEDDSGDQAPPPPPPAEEPMTAQQDNLARQQGSWSVYRYYYQSAGAISVFFWAFFTLLGAVSINIMPLWIEKWTNANEEEPNQKLGLYLGVYAVFLVVSVVGSAGECWVFFIRIINDTALKLHSDLLRSTLRAPFSFFQDTDTGTITNRFSQDMDLIDMALPSQAIQFTTGAASCAVQLLILCVLGKYLAAAIPALAVTLFLVQRYYLRTSRQVRLLDIEAKAPLYKLFLETAEGVATIRAFRWASRLHGRNAELLNRSQRPFYMLLCVQQWLALVLDLVVGGLAVVLVAVAMSTADSLSGGALGVALVLILAFNSLLGQTIQAWTKMETSIGAVARVQQFVQDTPAEPEGIEEPEPEWPQRGAIQFRDVVAGYPSSNAPVLTNLSLTVAPGEKVAICGSSGGGKTSLIMAILRMIELKGGSISIDSHDLASLSGDQVRERLNVVPQDPYFMPGTVRFNLDPQMQSTDGNMEAALRRVDLWARVEVAGGLDAELVSSSWSQGERQLLCLARALLVRSRILILDEATSSVDGQTEATMQAVIDADFGQTTVLSVQHRLTFIESFDRVAVLRQGLLVECDKPQVLLARESVFRDLYRAHHDMGQH